MELDLTLCWLDPSNVALVTGYTPARRHASKFGLEFKPSKPTWTMPQCRGQGDTPASHPLRKAFALAVGTECSPQKRSVVLCSCLLPLTVRRGEAPVLASQILTPNLPIYESHPPTTISAPAK